MAADRWHDEAPALKARLRTSEKMAFHLPERIGDMLNCRTSPESESRDTLITFRTENAPTSQSTRGFRQMRHSFFPFLAKRFRSSKIYTTVQERLIQNSQVTPRIVDSPALGEARQPKTHPRPSAPIWQAGSLPELTAATVNEAPKRTLALSQKVEQSPKEQAASSVVLTASQCPRLITADAGKPSAVHANEITREIAPSATANPDSPQIDCSSPPDLVLTGLMTSTAVAATTITINFLEFPPEIRNVIYSFALSFSAPLKQKLSSNASCRNEFCAMYPPPNVSQLLCVGKQVYAEALPFLYRQNTFIFQNLKCFLEILERMEPSTIDFINYITLHKVPLDEAHVAWGEVGRFLTPSSRQSSLRALHRIFKLRITAFTFSQPTSIQAQSSQQAVFNHWDSVRYDRWRRKNWPLAPCAVCDSYRQGAKLGGDRARSWEIGSIEQWKEECISLRNCTTAFGGQFMDRVEVVLERWVRR